MLSKSLWVAAILLAACGILVAMEPAGEPASDIYEGKVMAVTENTLMLMDDRDNEVESFAVNAGTKITFNGKPAKLEEIQMGDRVFVKGQVFKDRQIALTINAFRPL
jgi:hypothetical protein